MIGVALVVFVVGCDPGTNDDETSELAAESSESELAGEGEGATDESVNRENVTPPGGDGESAEVSESETEAVEEEVVEEDELIPAVDGIPAPGGTACPFPEPWGYKKDEYLKNMAFKNCAGEVVTMYDAACGAAVSWVYFTYGW